MEPVFLTHHYAPHVLNAARALDGVGRRSTDQYIADKPVPWYTTWCFLSGAPILRRLSNEQVLSTPTCLVIPPQSDSILSIPRGCEFAWVDWGVTTAERIGRRDGYALRYKKRAAQPDTLATWGMETPLIVPDSMMLSTSNTVDIITHEWNGGPFGRRTADAQLALWIMRWLEALQTPAYSHPWIVETPHPEARKSVEFARNHLSRLYSIDVWAAHLQVSRQHLNRLMRQHYSYSATDVLNRLRHERAHQLLSPDMPVAILAEQLGFMKIDTFRRWFRVRFNTSYDQYRRRLQVHK